jgi:hypothetical protein
LSVLFGRPKREKGYHPALAAHPNVHGEIRRFLDTAGKAKMTTGVGTILETAILHVGVIMHRQITSTAAAQTFCHSTPTYFVLARHRLICG